MLRETGMPISEIRKMAQPCRQPGTDSERLALLERHGDRVIAEQQRIARHLEAIENKIAFYRAALPYGVSVSRSQRVARDVSALGFWSSPCRPIGVRLTKAARAGGYRSLRISLTMPGRWNRSACRCGVRSGWLLGAPGMNVGRL
jgi:hypothetical protein